MTFGVFSCRAYLPRQTSRPLNHVHRLQYTQSTRDKPQSPRTRVSLGEYQDRPSSLAMARDHLLSTSCQNPSLSHCAFNFSTSLALPTSIISESKILPIPPESIALSRVFVIGGSGFLGLYSVHAISKGRTVTLCRSYAGKPTSQRPQKHDLKMFSRAVAECLVLHTKSSSLPSTALRPKLCIRHEPMHGAGTVARCLFKRTKFELAWHLLRRE